MAQAPTTFLVLPRRRFTVDDYDRMDEIGLFGHDERLELLDGVFYIKDTGHVRPFTADEYERMAEAGILRDDERVELIEGEVIEMSRIGSPHAACVRRLSQTLFSGVRGRAIVMVQDPIRLAVDNEPEPDVALARPQADNYQSGHPTPADLLLVIEVMDTSALTDRRVKLPLYARYGIPEVWLIDLQGGFIEVHRDPKGGAYAYHKDHGRGESIAPAAFPDIILAVDAILNRSEP